MPRLRGAKFYFGIDVLHACDAVFRAIRATCPHVLAELRAIPLDPPEGLCECRADQVAALSARARQNGGAFHLLTPLAEISIVGHELRRHPRIAASVEERLRRLLTPPKSAERTRRYAIRTGEPITTLRGPLIGRACCAQAADADWSQREWRQILLLSIGGHLSDNEIEMLRRILHEWSPSPVADLSDQQFGVVALLTQRLLHEHLGLKGAQQLGLVPSVSLIDVDIERSRSFERMGVDGPEMVWAVAVPPEVCGWAAKWSLDRPGLESTAALLRSGWLLQPDEPLPLSDAATTKIAEITRGMFSARRYKNLRRVPFEPRPPLRQLSRHAEWLVRARVLNQSPASIAREFQCHRQAVESAVEKLAGCLGLRRASPRRSGRPPCRRETVPRHTVQK